MAESNEKRKQLDDEMSRFEAEISGSPKDGSLSIPEDLRPIIGSSTFRKVQQQLQKGPSDSTSLPPPPEPPQLSTPKSRGPQFSPNDRPSQRFGTNSPDASHRRFNNQSNFNRGNNDIFPGPPDGPPDRRSGAFGPLIPPPPPPSFHNQHTPQNGPNFPGPCRGMAPHPPPGFIPPQVNRSIGGPMMGPGPGPGPNVGPRLPVNFLPPPPPPPGLMSQGVRGFFPSSVISKPPSIISSAPKLYTKGPSDDTTVQNTPENLPKKKKQKTEVIKEIETPLSSFTHAQEMAEKVKQSIITSTKVAPIQNGPSHNHPEEKKKEKKSKKNLRYAGGQVWEDPGLNEWEGDDFRMFAGDLGNDVTDELLHRYFSHFPSFLRAKVVREKRTNKSKGYGFISFKDPQDYIRAMKEMNGKYVGSRPIKLRKSSWRDRSLDNVQKKLKEKQTQGLK